MWLWCGECWKMTHDFILCKNNICAGWNGLSWETERLRAWARRQFGRRQFSGTTMFAVLVTGTLGLCEVGESERPGATWRYTTQTHTYLSHWAVHAAGSSGGFFLFSLAFGIAVLPIGRHSGYLGPSYWSRKHLKSKYSIIKPYLRNPHGCGPYSIHVRPMDRAPYIVHG